MSEKLWEVDKAKSHDHWLELNNPGADTWWHAYVKWDGCLEICSYFNLPKQDQESAGKTAEHVEQMHVCDLDDFIARLQALRDEAKAYFKDWPPE